MLSLTFNLWHHCSAIQPTTDLTAGDSNSGSPTWNDYPSWDENEHAPSLQRGKVLTS